MNAGRTSPIVVVILVLMACWMCGQRTGIGQSAAQENGDAAERRPAGEIAVVNIGSLFQHHNEFKQRIAVIRKQIEEANKQVAVRQVEIESVQRKLQQLKPGSPAYDDTQLLLARLQTELKLSSDRQRQGFLKQEARLYSDTYDEITETIASYAKENGIRLVLRANQGSVDPNNQKSVVEAVNRQVVYHAGLDITKAILEELGAAEVD